VCGCADDRVFNLVRIPWNLVVKSYRRFTPWSSRQDSSRALSRALSRDLSRAPSHAWSRAQHQGSSITSSVTCHVSVFTWGSNITSSHLPYVSHVYNNLPTPHPTLSLCSTSSGEKEEGQEGRGNTVSNSGVPESCTGSIDFFLAPTKGMEGKGKEAGL
jgi:hypothetical protein